MQPATQADDPLAELYTTHRQGLYTLAVAVTGSPAHAEDAVQDAFLRLWRNGPVTGDPVAYVHRAVRNAAIDQRRRVSRATAPEALAFLAAPAPAEVADHAPLRAALAGLPPEQREAVVLHLYAGLTFAQAAEVLDEPLATVASRYRRALDRLRTRLCERNDHG